MNQNSSDFEQFITLFSRLKAACGGDVNALLAEPIPAPIQDAAEEFWDFMSQSRFATATVARPGSQHFGVATNFANLWNEFDALWDFPLSAAGYDCASRWALEESGPISSANPALLLPDPEVTEVLFSRYHDLPNAYQQVSAVRTERAHAAKGLTTPRDVVDQWAVQLETVLEQEIGLSPERAFGRWQRLPTFHHKAGSSKSQLQGIAAAAEVLDHACLAYVAGADVAALAACRAAFELILKRIYFPNESARKLQNVTQLGRERYPSFPWNEIDAVRRAANNALHDHHVSAADDQDLSNTVQRAFKVIKFLIDNAPAN